MGALGPARHADPRAVGRHRHVDGRLRRRDGAARPGRPVGGRRVAGARDDRFAAAATCSATTRSASVGCDRWPRDACSARSGSTEPDAGSDARGIQHPRGAARRRLADQRPQDVHLQRGHRHVVRGDAAGAHRVGRRTARRRSRASSSRRTPPGFTMGPKMRGIGWRGLDTRELFFDDVWVADDHLVGDPAMGLSQFLRHARGRAHLDRGAVAQPDPGGARPGARLRRAARSSSASRSRSSRRSSSSSPTSPPSSRRRAGSRTAPRPCATPGSRSSRKRRWRS